MLIACDAGDYLYFWYPPGPGQWRIGPDYKSGQPAAVTSTPIANTWCPTQASEWRAWITTTIFSSSVKVCTQGEFLPPDAPAEEAK